MELMNILSHPEKNENLESLDYLKCLEKKIMKIIITEIFKTLAKKKIFWKETGNVIRERKSGSLFIKFKNLRYKIWGVGKESTGCLGLNCVPRSPPPR